MRGLSPLLPLVLFAACRPTPASAPAGEQGAGPVAAVTTEAPALEAWVEELDLSFEREDGPPRWLSSQGRVIADATQARAGRRSLRLTSQDADVFVMAMLPIERLRDRRVRLGGWIRTAAVGELAGLWVRVDGGAGEVLGFESMQGRGPKGTTEWARFEIEVDVPPEAQQVMCGAQLEGGGEAWFDALDLSLKPYVPPAPIEVSGRVIGGDGAPVAGALVAGVSPMRARPAAVARTDAGGRFTLELRPGAWAFTATAAQGAAYREPAEFRDKGEVELRLGGGFALAGTVSIVGRRPAELRVVATRRSAFQGDVFAAAVGADGRFALRLPEAEGYSVSVWADDALVEPLEIPGRGDQGVALTATLPGPPPESVVAWIRGEAAPIAGFEAGGDLADMKPLRAMVRGARIVALGEATHGTREFFQMKHRVLEYLVLREGFRLFLIEANLTEARAVNDYVLRGKGDPAEALSGLGVWTWDTEEVLALVEWMRRYNADPAHKEKLQFLGFDMQKTAGAWGNVAAYLGQVEPGRALPAALAVFAELRAAERWPALSAEERRACRAEIDGIVARLDEGRAGFVARAGAQAWRHAREDARLVAQAAEMFDADGPRASYEARDRAMAENVGWLLRQEGRSARAVLWAHNAHVSRRQPRLVNMGRRLSEAHGPGYLSVGFGFSEGSFQAIGGERLELREFTVGPPTESDLGTAFTRAGCERCYVDLRRAPGGEVAEWLRAIHPMRDHGALFTEAELENPVRISEAFDALIFVRQTTRARPLAKPKP